MTALSSRLENLLGVAKTFTHCSEQVAKALAHNAEFSTKRWPYDLQDGQYHRGVVSCVDMSFVANERSRNHPSVLAGTVAFGHASSLPADTERVILGEWPTGSRLRSIDYHMTIAETNASYPESGNGGSDYWAHMTNYFTQDVIAAFPDFTLWAEDPDDSSFTPILLIEEADTTATKQGRHFSVAASAFGVNRRKKSLLITMTAQGAVPVDSALFLNMEFTEQHK